MKLKLVTSLFISIIFSATSFADVLTLKKDHPKTYTVVKGDTLWDISAHFLNTPWLWPRLWQANNQIENPHLIYPGDLLTLIWVNGEPKITRKQLKKLSPTPRLTEKKKAIPTIPLSAISAFLSKDHVINSELLKTAPHLLGGISETKRFLAGDVFYAQGKYDKNKLYGIYRLGQEYLDPDTEEQLGSKLIFIGYAQVSKNDDYNSTDKATPLDFLNSTREARQGDLILEIPEYESLPAYFLPQSVPTSLTGYILDATTSKGVFGTNDVVVINKGKRENVKIGSMFSILRTGPEVFINEDGDSIAYQGDASRFDKMEEADIVLPSKRIGELMVFKVYEKTSIALIMRSTTTMNVNDTIQGVEF